MTGLWTGTPLTYKGTYYTPSRTPTFCHRRTRHHGFRFGSLASGPARARFVGPRAGMASSPLDGPAHSAQTIFGRCAPISTITERRPHRLTWCLVDAPMKLTAAKRSAHVAEYAAAGVTWWLESVWPGVALTEVRSIIDQGPPSPHRLTPNNACTRSPAKYAGAIVVGVAAFSGGFPAQSWFS